MQNVSVNHVVLSKLMNYVKDHGYKDRDIYRVLRSNEFTLRYSSGLTFDELRINYKEYEDQYGCLLERDKSKITRWFPSAYLNGDFYKALKMIRVMFQNDIELYQKVINSKRILDEIKK